MIVIAAADLACVHCVGLDKHEDNLPALTEPQNLGEHVAWVFTLYCCLATNKIMCKYILLPFYFFKIIIFFLPLVFVFLMILLRN